MSSIGAAEIILVLLIAFIVVGPEDLPKVARALGRFFRTIRLMITQVKKETGLDEVEAEVKDIRRELKQTGKDLDIRQQLKETKKDIDADLKDIKKDVDPGAFKKVTGDLDKDLKKLESDVK